MLIDEDETELAVRVLHTAYGLDAAEDVAVKSKGGRILSAAGTYHG